MVKAYLRYRYAGDLGVVASSEANVSWDVLGKSVITGANETVAFWDAHTAERLGKLSYRESTGDCRADTFHSSAVVTQVRQHPVDNKVIVAGHADGSVRIWDRPSGSVSVTLYGHKSGVSALEFSSNGHLLASGGFDSDIVLWDVVGQAGLFRLQGHKNRITSLCFLYRRLHHVASTVTSTVSEAPPRPKKRRRRAGSPDPKDDIGPPPDPPVAPSALVEFSRDPVYLLSSSCDGTIRVWDLASQWCVQTIFDSCTEVSSLAVNPTQTRMVAGSAGRELKIYKLSVAPEAGAPSEAASAEATSGPASEGGSAAVTVVEYSGSVRRPAAGKHKVAQLIYAVDVEDLVSQFQTAAVCEGGPGLKSVRLVGSAPHEQVSRQGSLLTGSDCQAASSNARRLLLVAAGSKNSRSIEVYRELPPTQCAQRLKHRKRRAIANLKKKRRTLAEVQALYDKLDGQCGGALLRKPVGTAYEAEKETTRKKLEELMAEMQQLQMDSKAYVPAAHDEFQYVTTFHLKKRCCAIDYCQVAQSLAVIYSDNSFEIFSLPLHQLLEGSFSTSNTGDGDHILSEEISAVSRKEQPTLVSLQASTLGLSGEPQSLALSHDDGAVATFAGAAIRVWDLETLRPSRHLVLKESVTTGFFVAGNAHLLIGTIEGRLMLVDLASCAVTTEEKVHDGAITAISEHPDKTGFVTTSTDKTLRFFQFHILRDKATDSESVSFKSIADTNLMDEGIAVKFSPNGKLTAVSLLDFTIQLFYTDSVKLFLTLYGHKLPVGCIDISSDSTLLVSGSADKTLKVWGVDFGNIHKSWHAHNGPVTQVVFLRGTHYVASAGKDALIKLWDTDRRELITQLAGHTKGIGSLIVTRLDADRIIAGGSDWSVRVWRRTDEQIFAHEEREKIMEEMLESEATRADIPVGGGAGAPEVVMTRASRKTIESVRSTEGLMEAIDLASRTWEEQRNYLEALATWEAQSAPISMGKPAPPRLVPELRGLSPHRHLFNVVTSINSAMLHEVVVALPFRFAEKLLLFVGSFLEAMSASGQSVAFEHTHPVAKVTLLAVHIHMRQFLVTSKHREYLLAIYRHLRPELLKEKECLEFNAAALKLLQKQVKANLEARALFL